jgi:molybdopterin synthase sulfur carrier subunit
MKGITVLAFGRVAELTGKSSFVVNDVDSTTQLKQKLEEDYPALKSISFAIAVNKKMATAAMPLDDNATVALLPPFSGG